MREKLKGSLTVEGAFVIPFVLFLFAMLMYLFFYYHDKSVLAGSVQSAAIYGDSREMPTEQQIEAFLTKEISGRLLYFSNIEKEIELEKTHIMVRCFSEKNSMTVEGEYKLSRTKPEQFIRNLRKAGKLREKVEDEVEDTYKK